MTTPELITASERTLELDKTATRKPWKSKLNHAPYKVVVIDASQDYTTLELKPEDADLIAHVRTFAPAAAQWILGAVEREKKKDAALEEFRDCVLNNRDELESPCLDNDQTNAVLRLFDRLITEALK